MTAYPADLRERERLDTRDVHLNQNCFRSSQVNPRDQARVELRNPGRKVTRDRGQFLSGQAALKVLYLAVRNLEEFRSRTVGIRSSGCHHQSQS